MGADIHIFIERKDFGSNYWYGFGDNIHAERSYTMFGAIAGVRSDEVTPISEPRGFPPDYNQGDKDEKDKYDFHSWTYLTPNELEVAILRATELYAKTSDGPGDDDYLGYWMDYKIILEFCRDLERNNNDVRLVIGFDS